MNTLVIVIVVAAALAAVAAITWLGSRGSVPGRLARAATGDGTHHGSDRQDRAATDRPGDPGAEDQLAYAGDAGPGQPVAGSPPATAAPPPAPATTTVPGVDPDAPGGSVDDVTSPEAVEPNEPA